VVLQDQNIPVIIALVFHRILDFKTGLDFYPGPFFINNNSKLFVPHSLF